MDKFEMVASAYGLFVRDNNILLLRRFDTGFEDGNYGLPAGHVEDNESITSAACREIKEETGVILKPQDVSLIHVMHRKGKDIRVDFFFEIHQWDTEPTNAEPHKCDDLSWFPINNLPTSTIPYIKEAIQNYQAKKNYSEFGW